MLEVTPTGITVELKPKKRIFLILFLVFMILVVIIVGLVVRRRQQSGSSISAGQYVVTFKEVLNGNNDHIKSEDRQRLAKPDYTTGSNLTALAIDLSVSSDPCNSKTIDSTVTVSKQSAVLTITGSHYEPDLTNGFGVSPAVLCGGSPIDENVVTANVTQPFTVQIVNGKHKDTYTITADDIYLYITTDHGKKTTADRIGINQFALEMYQLEPSAYMYRDVIQGFDYRPEKIIADDPVITELHQLGAQKLESPYSRYLQSTIFQRQIGTYEYYYFFTLSPQKIATVQALLAKHISETNKRYIVRSLAYPTNIEISNFYPSGFEIHLKDDSAVIAQATDYVHNQLKGTLIVDTVPVRIDNKRIVTAGSTDVDRYRRAMILFADPTAAETSVTLPEM